MGNRGVVVAGGVHGDEPSGALVLPLLADAGFLTCGPLNPWGLAHNRRHLEDGRDLNRSFAHRGCTQAEEAKAFLRENPPGLLLDLHEDCDSDRPYLIQIGPQSRVGSRLIATLRKRYAFHPWPRFGALVGRRGLIHPPAWMLWGQRVSRRWSLVFWSWQEFEVPSVVVEVPADWGLEEKLTFFQELCAVARRAVRSRPDSRSAL